MRRIRIMAHHIDAGGVLHRLSIAETDSRGYLLGIEPYRCETANTEFRNGTVTFRPLSRRGIYRLKLSVTSD